MIHSTLLNDLPALLVLGAVLLGLARVAYGPPAD